jgi:hypothetical protein
VGRRTRESRPLRERIEELAPGHVEYTCLTKKNHSWRRATMGSTRVARACGDVAGGKRDRRKQQGDRRERSWVHWAHAEKQTAHQPCCRQRGYRSQTYSRCGQLGTAGQNQAKDALGTGAESQADSDFAVLLANSRCLAAPRPGRRSQAKIPPRGGPCTPQASPRSKKG